jgi:DNA-binding MarR family transcriptional regulator
VKRNWSRERGAREKVFPLLGPAPPPPCPLPPSSARHPLDFYESPSWFTTELLRHVKISGVIGEPCVGGGAIADLLKIWPHTESLWTNDIDSNKPADYHLDAIAPQSWDQFPETDWIITNPPYSEFAAPIIKNAFEKSRVGVVAFLLTGFLEPCDDRADFLGEHPPSLVLTLPRYCFRKDKKGKRWATDNSTISCFVWDKRATSQRLVVRSKSEIVGFYKNPDGAISFSEVQEIVGSIATGEISTNYKQMNTTDSWNPADFGDVPYKAEENQLTIFYDTNEPPDPDDYPSKQAYEQSWSEWEKKLRRDNARAGNYIVDEFESLGIIKENLGFGFVVDWLGVGTVPNPPDGKDITYNWERDRDRINTFSIAPQSLVPQNTNPIQEPKAMTATFQFSATSAIASQIAQLQEQLNALTATLKPYQECEQKAEELRRQVAKYGQEMKNRLIPQEDILRWGRSLYSAATEIELVESDNGVVAAQNQVIAELKAELAIAHTAMNQFLSEQTKATISPDVEILKQEIEELKTINLELRSQLDFERKPADQVMAERLKKLPEDSTTISERIVNVLKGQNDLSGNKIIESLGMSDEAGRGVYTVLNRLVAEGVISRSPDPLDKRRNLYRLSSENTQQNTQHSEENTQHDTLTSSVSEKNTQHGTLTSHIGDESELVAVVDIDPDIEAREFINV